MVRFAALLAISLLLLPQSRAQLPDEAALTLSPDTVFPVSPRDGAVHEILREDVDPLILSNSGSVVLAIAPGWYSNRRKLRENLSGLASERAGIDFYIIDDVELGPHSSKLRVFSYPTVLAFQGGEHIARLQGLQSAQSYASWIDATFAN